MDKSKIPKYLIIDRYKIIVILFHIDYILFRVIHGGQL